MSEVSRDLPRARPVYRWAPDGEGGDPVLFPLMADALAAAAFATGLPWETDTIHLVSWPDGLTVAASTAAGTLWVKPR